jgi:S-adenosylmethionine:tRNA ribosyltransferase-isomerase
MLQKPSGGVIEALFLNETSPGKWRVLLKNAGRVPLDSELQFAGNEPVRARIEEKFEGGEFLLSISPPRPANDLLARLGRMPLPPYIKRQKGEDPRDAMDRDRYQTVFAREAGAVAAPTAALHFSQGLLGQLEAKGIDRTFVTLHVGLGTFKPVAAERLEDHPIHRERYSIGESAAATLNRAKSEGRRIIAVGTTSARVLESQPADTPFAPGSDETGIFIYPSYRWKHVSALITNFHLPHSTLLALVAALVGLDEQRRIYETAIEQRYRFFSYGDAMLIE